MLNFSHREQSTSVPRIEALKMVSEGLSRNGKATEGGLEEYGMPKGLMDPSFR